MTDGEQGAYQLGFIAATVIYAGLLACAVGSGRTEMGGGLVLGYIIGLVTQLAYHKVFAV